jgi:hypothetical protein
MFANYHAVTGIVNKFVIANSAQHKEPFFRLIDRKRLW